MRKHGRHRAAGDQWVEVASLPVALHGRTGLAPGLSHLPGRTLAGLGVGPRTRLSETLSNPSIPAVRRKVSDKGPIPQEFGTALLINHGVAPPIWMEL